MVNHYSNLSHALCDHGSTFKADYIPISNPQAQTALWNIFKYYASRAAHFKLGRLTNTIESLNRMVVSYSSKNIDERKNYPMAANLAAAKKNDGFQSQLEI